MHRIVGQPTRHIGRKRHVAMIGCDSLPDGARSLLWLSFRKQIAAPRPELKPAGYQYETSPRLGSMATGILVR
jgi:hypothetical protein